MRGSSVALHRVKSDWGENCVFTWNNRLLLVNDTGVVWVKTE